MTNKYDIFISYKRKSLPTANNLYYRLTTRGYSTFFDLEEMGRDNFNVQLLSYIENAKDVFIILEEGSLDGCNKENWEDEDWFCHEIAFALEKKKNIIPILLNGYKMPSEKFLPDKLKELRLKNAPEFNFSFFEAYLDKLIEKEYLISKPNLQEKATSVFKFYSNENCQVFKEGKLVCSLEGMSDEPYYLPVSRKGEYRFKVINELGDDSQTIDEIIDTSEEKKVEIIWEQNKNFRETLPQKESSSMNSNKERTINNVKVVGYIDQISTSPQSEGKSTDSFIKPVKPSDSFNYLGCLSLCIVIAFILWVGDFMTSNIPLYLLCTFIGIYIITFIVKGPKFMTQVLRPNESTEDDSVSIDLGLPSGTRWACCNVGADTPEQLGNSYAWGEVTTKNEYSFGNYSVRKITLTSIIASSFDAATKNWDKSWCMPSFEQFEELVNYCSWVWVEKPKCQGYQIIGCNGNELFLPSPSIHNSQGNYWTVDEKFPYQLRSKDDYEFINDISYGDTAYALVFDKYHFSLEKCDKYLGFNIRPVKVMKNKTGVRYNK